MDTISVEQTDRLLWLGRYSERVYTTLRLYSESYDQLIDGENYSYSEFCNKLDIPDIYESKEDFKTRYPFDENDANSIYSNLLRAYDNAIVLREEIGSETLAYIQLAIYDMQKARISRSPLIEMQNVIDNLLAFWGIADDMIDSERTRNIIKTGKRVERIDLYARLELGRAELLREVHRLMPRVERSGISYGKNSLREILRLVESEHINYQLIVEEIDNLIEV